MMHCPLCGHVAHTRSSRYLSGVDQRALPSMPQHQLQLHVRHARIRGTGDRQPGDDIVPAQPHPLENQHKQSAAAL